MSLHTSENVRCFFECERMNFSIFWHHHEQSPHLTSGYILKLTSNHKFSINHAVSWNLVLFSLIHFGHFPKITWKISDIFSLWDIFVWLKMALWPNWLKFLWSFQNKFGLWPTNPRKKTWNTVKRNVFNFSGNSIGSALHGCCFLGSNCLILHPIRTMFFNELVQFSVDGLSSWANSNVKTAQLDSGFCVLVGKPTTQNRLNLFWNT